MNRVFLLLLPLLSATAAPSFAEEGNAQMIDSINALLAHASTDALPDADRIEIFLLQFGDETDAVEHGREAEFVIAGTDRAFRILAGKEVRGKDCDRLVSAWRRTSISTGAGAFCHVPKYGVRIYNGSRLLLETTVSHECKNFYMPQIDPNTGSPVFRMTSFGGGEHTLLRLLGSYFR